MSPDKKAQAELDEYLARQAADRAAAKAEEEAAEVEEPLPRPWIGVEDGSQVHLMTCPAGSDPRDRRISIGGNNHEHVSEIDVEGETIWVFRRM